MALFNECRERHAHIALDTADIVRDGDLSTVRSQGNDSRALLFGNAARWMRLFT